MELAPVPVPVLQRACLPSDARLCFYQHRVAWTNGRRGDHAHPSRRRNGNNPGGIGVLGGIVGKTTRKGSDTDTDMDTDRMGDGTTV